MMKSRTNDVNWSFQNQEIIVKSNLKAMAHNKQRSKQQDGEITAQHLIKCQQKNIPLHEFLNYG